MGNLRYYFIAGFFCPVYQKALYVCLHRFSQSAQAGGSEWEAYRQEMRLKRKHFMIGQEHISKLTRIKKHTGASESHSVRKAITNLRELRSGTKRKKNTLV